MKQGMLDRQAKLLLAMHTLYITSMALSNTFVNVYFWKMKKDYIAISLYNLLSFVAIPLTFWVAGYIAKRLDRVYSIRTGIVIAGLFFSIVLLLGERAHEFMYGLGALLGVGSGFYWLGYNVMYFEITNRENRDLFNGTNGLLNSTAGMAAPFFAGWLLSNVINGYTLIFSLSLTIFAAAVLLSFFIHSRQSRGQFTMRKVWQDTIQETDWYYSMLTHFFLGLREGVLLFLINLLVYVVSAKEFSLGIYVLATSGTSLVAFYLAGKWMKPHMRQRSILIGIVMSSIAVLPLFIGLNFGTLIVYGILSSVFFPLFNIPIVSTTFDLIGSDPARVEHRVEYIVFRETFLNAGRILSVSAFIGVVALNDEPAIFPYILLAVNAVMLLSVYTMGRIYGQEGYKTRKRAKI
ncbi:MFS transporter [Aneurinibacillus sp. Ricciae_BoGa-3]|uniref:MFS transporter n=1 Tax=Aneurinibacillus sp. Ricciae_BoGa-3 TaxID=3022697 RepID=UPI002340690A|nr:MFS transporter [Aneurinibacillus sp. Ricciae_BoGa-3]WCK54944.1 MFS transporter [Aneurinibacillus sp. Ricciae_BoGa-3]